MMELLRQTPIWVYPLFLFLLFMGWQQTRDRKVIFFVPFIFPVIMAIYSMVTSLPLFNWSDSGTMLLLLFSLSAVVFLLSNRQKINGAVYLARDRQFFIPGSYLPLTIILIVFSVKYVTEACMTLSPEIANTLYFRATLAIINGTLLGFFISRIAQYVRVYLFKRQNAEVHNASI